MLSTSLGAPAGQSKAGSAQKSQALFQKVFGDAVKLDPAMIAKVKSAKPGERSYLDRNGDGKSDECWFIDASPRHTKARQPLLVRAIDEDGDMDAYQGPDLDSDMYVADAGADGIVDSIVDYADLDHDNDVDEMAFYFYMPHHPFFGDDVLRVWWGRDDGDDNLLWYDVDYNYDQAACQYRCHFSGDESFVAFGLPLSSIERQDAGPALQWLSAYENPFLFYDPDRDRCSEIVLRIEGQGSNVRAIRYSFDADDDAHGERTHDYDFSITAVAEKDRPVQLPEDTLIRTHLRGVPTQGWLDRDKARPFVTQATWSKALLTWDELNANTEENVARDPHERWEGIIAHGNAEFPQVGGPACSVFNKRNELAVSPTAPLSLYYDPSDRKLHLKGASKGWLKIDYDLDGKADATFTDLDENGDGLFDRRQIDVDGDDQIDFDWKVNPRVQHQDLNWDHLQRFYTATLPKILQDSQTFLDTATSALPELAADPVRAFFTTRLSGWMPQTHLGEYIRRSPAGARLYLDLARDRAFAAVRKKFNAHALWPRVEVLYSQGDYAIAADLLQRIAGPGSRPKNTVGFGAFGQRLELQLTNPGKQPRTAWPIAIPIADIRKVAADFNPVNCTVVAPERWIDWRCVPHQVDEADAATGPELTFLADLPAGASATYHLFYSPEGAAEGSFAKATGTAEDWVPPNIGWESDRCAYRAYWGQFDFFGKKTDQLIYDDIGAKSYHGEVEWGIDALHVGTASGLGGLTLYRGETGYLVQNPAGKGDVQFAKRQLAAGPVRAVAEITATHIVPDAPNLGVKMTCIIYAGRQESEIRAQVTGANGETILAPGICKLPRESAFADETTGAFGSWGWQQEVIGDIGMAVIAAPQSVVKVVDLAEERRMLCRTAADGRLRYWILGDWRRGRQHPIAPTIDNWKSEVGELSGLLNQDIIVKVGRMEDQ